jgi:hypothetical protein
MADTRNDGTKVPLGAFQQANLNDS